MCNDTVIPPFYISAITDFTADVWPEEWSATYYWAPLTYSNWIVPGTYEVHECPTST